MPPDHMIILYVMPPGYNGAAFCTIEQSCTLFCPVGTAI